MSKKKKALLGHILTFVIFCGVGMAGGYLLGRGSRLILGDNPPTYQEFLLLCLLILAFVLFYYLHIIIHEAGHLVCGLLSGYRFSSFRIGSLMWMKEDGKTILKRLKIAGTGGQCLMAPPPMQDGKIPVILYNLGGVLANLLASLLAVGVLLLCREHPLAMILAGLFAAIGLFDGLLNGLPLQLGGIHNDGRNALDLGKNPAALRAFWIQMACGEQLSRGARLRDLPAEWFTLPSDEELKNSMVAPLAVFACNRLMDEGRLSEADDLMTRLLDSEAGLIGLHRQLLVCDQMTCEMLGENRPERLESLLSKEQKAFMKSMKTFPSVLRTGYAYVRLARQDEEEAAQIRQLFDKAAASYPYAGDIQGEQALMNKIDAASAGGE